MNRVIRLYSTLIKYRRYTIPNIVGMGLAIGALIMIFQFVSFELSYDQYHKNKLARVISTRFQDGEKLQSSTVTYSAVGPALVNHYQEIMDQSRVFPFGNAVVHFGESNVNVSKCVAVEASFFTLFEMKVLAGSISELFDKPNQIILTKTTSDRLFGPQKSYEGLINQTIQLDNDADLYTVVGVVEDMPINSHLSYNLFMSYETIISTWGISQARYDWKMVDFRHYVLLKEEVDLDLLNEDLRTFSGNYLTENESDYEYFMLEGIEDVYLSDHKLAYDIAKHGDKQTMIILISLGFVLFIVSWINYLNLNASWALEKRRFVGIKKVLGAEKTQLRQSLILEISVVYVMSAFVGMIFSFFLTDILQKLDFEIMNLQDLFSGGYIHTPLMLMFIGLLVAGGAFSTVSYYRLASNIKPLQALRARSGQVKGSSMVSKALLGLQFTLSMLAFSSGLVIYDQLSYIQSQPKGLDMENLWVLQQPKLTRTDSTFSSKLQTFKSNLLSDPMISRVTTNQRSPGQQLQVDYNAKVDMEEAALSYIMVDQDYLSTYDLQIISGRGFSSSDVKNQLSNVRNIVINEAGLKVLKATPAEAIGKQIELHGAKRTVIGVVNNFRQESLMHDFQPTAILPMIHSNHQIVIRASGSPDQWINKIEDEYSRSFPGNSIEYRHLQSEYEEQYASIYSASRSVGFFTLFIVMVSMFGMIALASLNLLSRVKEIGVKKVLGASESELYQQILKSYLMQFLVANLIAIPFAYSFTREWLKQFVEGIKLGMYHLVLPMICMIVIISIVLLMTSRKIIRTNPVAVLRSE